MSEGMMVDLLNGALTIVLAYLYATERNRTMKAKAEAEMWKRMAQKRTDNIANGLED